MGDSSTFSDVSGDSVKGVGSEGFMLFGVRVVESSFRKSVSMINLAQYDEKLDQYSNIDVSAAGYVSDDIVHPFGRIRERKKGVPWTEEEHKLFLLGLQKLGKGDWRGISRNFVKTRTPTQVASHAQKYFIRRNNQNKRRRRSSLFDITADPALGVADEDKMHQDNLPKIQNKVCKTQERVSSSITPLIIPITIQNSLGQINQLNNSPKPIRPILILPLHPSSKWQI